MIDKAFWDKITMEELEKGKIKFNGVEISIIKKGNSLPHILVVCNGDPNSYSYSKYGLKQAKKWLIERYEIY